ncbi:MAG: hypothetical protein DFNUSKGM_003346, partial [Candidatus Fervidibacter sacchari]
MLPLRGLEGQAENLKVRTEAQQFCGRLRSCVGCRRDITQRNG